MGSYIYLGKIISFKDQIIQEINTRIATGWKKYWSSKEIMKSKDLGMELKKKMFKSSTPMDAKHGH